MVFDAPGNIELTWTMPTATTNTGVFFSHSSDRGATFTAPVMVPQSGENTGYPQIATDSQGNIFILWVNDGKDMSLTRSSDRGASFSPPTIVDNAFARLDRHRRR